MRCGHRSRHPISGHAERAHSVRLLQCLHWVSLPLAATGRRAPFLGRIWGVRAALGTPWGESTAQQDRNLKDPERGISPGRRPVQPYHRRPGQPGRRLQEDLSASACANLDRPVTAIRPNESPFDQDPDHTRARVQYLPFLARMRTVQSPINCGPPADEEPAASTPTWHLQEAEPGSLITTAIYTLSDCHKTPGEYRVPAPTWNSATRQLSLVR